MRIETTMLKNGWKEFKLVNHNGMTVSILNYGGIITQINVPNKYQKIENVVLGYENYQDYEKDSYFLGAMIGRVAGRIQNSEFKLDGEKYFLQPNDGAHHLHSGMTGFHKKIWQVVPFHSEEKIGLELYNFSPNDEGGYPGTVHVQVTYTLYSTNQFDINVKATSDRDTILTLTNHTYFNLNGNLKQSIKNHEVTVDSKYFGELDEELIPTGEILNVETTPFDFRQARKLADGIDQGIKQNSIVGNGFDHYFIFNSIDKENVAVFERTSGRSLKIKTDQPGMILYTGNNLPDGLRLMGGETYKYSGVCFETQASPASLHHEEFPSVYLKANEVYSKKTSYIFEVG